MKENLKLIFTAPDIRSRIIWTLALIVVFLVGSNITLPTVTLNGLARLDDASFFGVLNLLGGGGLRRFSFFALGISPYITSSIIMSLLSSDLIPPLKRLSQSGQKGKAKIDFITKTVTILVAIAQSIALLRGLGDQGLISYDTSSLGQFYLILIMISGSLITVWLGNLISKKGIGNGISIIVFTGVVSSLPSSFTQMFNFLINPDVKQEAFTGSLQFTSYIIGFIFLVLLIVFFQESVRKIPVQHSRSSFAKKSEELAFIPIKMNPSGIMPLIFATAAVSLPTTIASYINSAEIRADITDTLSLNNWSGMGIYAAAILLFSFFYNQIAVNSQQLSDNFLKSNTYIPGIRPGEETRKYIQKSVARISLIGAIFLIFIAIIPLLVSKLAGIPSSAIVSGSGLIIVVSVSLQFIDQMRGMLITYQYKNETDIVKKQSMKKKLTSWLASDSLRIENQSEEKKDESGDSILW